MARYKVIEDFKDLKDGGYRYYGGDEYPREGKRAATARIKELSGSRNKRGRPVIEMIEEYDDEQ